MTESAGSAAIPARCRFLRRQLFRAVLPVLGDPADQTAVGLFLQQDIVCSVILLQRNHDEKYTAGCQ